MQKNGAGLHTASSCFWDNTTDGQCLTHFMHHSPWCMWKVLKRLHILLGCNCWDAACCRVTSSKRGPYNTSSSNSTLGSVLQTRPDIHVELLWQNMLITDTRRSNSRGSKWLILDGCGFGLPCRIPNRNKSVFCHDTARCYQTSASLPWLLLNYRLSSYYTWAFDNRWLISVVRIAGTLWGILSLWKLLLLSLSYSTSINCLSLPSLFSSLYLTVITSHGLGLHYQTLLDAGNWGL